MREILTSPGGVGVAVCMRKQVNGEMGAGGGNGGKKFIINGSLLFTEIFSRFFPWSEGCKNRVAVRSPGDLFKVHILYEAPPQLLSLRK